MSFSPSGNNNRNVKRALLIVTSHTELQGTGKKTGFWFDELATPFWGFYDAGYEVTIASIQGGSAHADPLSAEDEFVTPAVQRFMQSDVAMGLIADTPCVDDINTNPFTTLFLCGGHGTLWDFKESRGLARIASEFYANKKLIGSVCHGPTGLLSATKEDGSPLVEGLRLTSFTDAEEKETPQQYIDALPYHLEDALVKQGACFKCEGINANFVVCEDGLITGQNPASVGYVTKTILDALDKTQVWIDTNLSLGEVSESGKPCAADDAYAIMSLFNAPNIKVKGMSCVFGDTEVGRVDSLAKTLSNRFGPVALPVVKGAAQALNINHIQENDAVRRLVKELKDNRLSIVAMGPVTNIATLLLCYPELAANIDQVTLVAGRSSVDKHFIVGSKQEVPFNDTNFDRDPDALRILLESGVPVVLTPFELGSRVSITQKDLNALGESAGVGRYLKKQSQAWLDMWRDDLGAAGFSPLSALAADFVINPNHYQYQQLPLEIRIAPDDSKATHYGTTDNYKPYLIVSEECQSSYRVLYCTGVDAEFSQRLISNITTPNNPAKYIAAVSHINIIVDDVDKAAAFYKRTLGFDQAYDEEGVIMDYPRLTLASFAKDAGFADGKVDVDIRFLHHPTAGLYLELMRYYTPKGDQNITIKNTNDMGGVRHTALEVNDIMEAFNYLKDQPGVEIVRYPDGREDDLLTPMVLNPFPMSFFYWRDQYGVQWEMECGRKRGYLRGI